MQKLVKSVNYLISVYSTRYLNSADLLVHSIVVISEWNYWMCTTELFAIHTSILNRKTSVQRIHQETEPKPRGFFCQKPIKTYHPLKFRNRNNTSCRLMLVQSMSAAQGTTVHDGLLHTHLRHCSSPAPAVCRQSLSCSYRDTGVPCSVVGPFSLAGLAAWNSLPDYLRDLTRSFDSFRSDLKTFLFSLY